MFPSTIILNTELPFPKANTGEEMAHGSSITKEGKAMWREDKIANFSKEKKKKSNHQKKSVKNQKQW